jgi:hypothetical protein
MQSKATTVGQYLKELPADRRAAISELRRVIRRNLPKGFQEGMQYGMIGYYVPHKLYPAGYHCDPKQPLPYVSLASQKNHMSLYLCAAYHNKRENDWFQKAWQETGKKLDMGKSCIRFKKIADVPLDVVAAAVARMSVDEFVEFYESVIKPGGRRGSSGSKDRAKKATRTTKAVKKSTPTIKKKKAAKKKQVPVKKSTKKRVQENPSSAGEKKRDSTKKRTKTSGTTSRSTRAGGAGKKTSKSSVRMKQSKRHSN